MGLSREAAVDFLEGTGDFRVLRRFVPHTMYNAAKKGIVRRGVYIDCETTGVNPEKDKVLEIALVPFVYEDDGILISVRDDQYTSYLQDPGLPLTEEIRHLTGITDQDLGGQQIDVAHIEEMLADATLVVAHNAGFDRRFAEKITPAFVDIDWACSQQDVPWRQAFGAPAAGLEVLATFLSGVYYNAHRALIDCQIGLHVLGTAVDKDGRSAFSHLLDNALSERYRIWALGAPYHTKDVLKARSYQWNGGEDGRPKAWHKSVKGEDITAETDWLRATCGVSGQLQTIFPRDRFSIRER